MSENGTSVVDYHIVSSPLFQFVTYFSVLFKDESDHLPIHAQLTFINKKRDSQKSPERSSRESNECFSRKFPKYMWNELYKEAFIYSFAHKFAENLHLLTNLVENDVNQAVSLIVDIYQNSSVKMLHKHNFRKQHQKNQPWWDGECDESKYLKYSALRHFRVTNAQCEYTDYIKARNNFKALCTQKKNANHFENRKKLLSFKNDPKNFWSLLKQNTSNYNSSASGISIENWKLHFENLLSKIDQPSLVNFDVNRSTTGDCSILNDSIHIPEVVQSIRNLKMGKSQGSDGLGAEFYKNTCNDIAPILCCLFNTILTSGVFPDMWRESIIIPVYKSGSRDDPSNYRGISLVNVMYKIFSNILHDRLVKWSDIYNKIDEAQAGFRSGYSTTDNLFTLQSLIQKYISKPGGRFYVLYVDFKQAFDSIVHYNLFRCLQKSGIHGNILNILVSMYSDIRGNVRVNNAVSSRISCNIGTRQGDVTSTILFNLYINELCTFLRQKGHRGIFVTENIPEIICLLFADDVANCSETAINLQLQLDSISEFCNNTGMSINHSKTEIMVFRNAGPLRNYERWTYNNNPVHVTALYKYMGLL